MDNNFPYFKNTQCKFFPCHKTDGEYFNCIFCYCPLYPLGDKCGGNFVYLESGVKDCSNCLVPHGKNGSAYIVSKFPEISDLAKKK